MTKPKIYIDGEHGTTGLQIIERIGARDDLERLAIPHADRHDVEARRKLLNDANIAILCLPDDAAREAVAMIETDTRVIDASTAHRVDPSWTFGFAELDPGHADVIAQSSRVTNPGCYSTGAIALIHPLTKAGVLHSSALVSINAVSGYSGGGKGMIAQMEDASRDDAITAPHFLYAVGLTHKHLPEITRYGGLDSTPIFSPSVGSFAQGMIVQVPLHMAALNATSRADVHTALEAHYARATNVRVAPLSESDSVARLDATALANTDTMDLHVFGNDTHINLVALLDNLGKGASGACVQALNLMLKGSA